MNRSDETSSSAPSDRGRRVIVFFRLVFGWAALAAMGLVIGRRAGAAVFYAGALLLGRYLRDVPAPTLARWETGAAAVAFAPLVLVGSCPFLAALRWPSIAILAVMGVAHTALALTLLLKGLQQIPARVASLLTYVDPISAVFFAWLFFGEHPGAPALVGALLVLTGNVVGRSGTGGLGTGD